MEHVAWNFTPGCENDVKLSLPNIICQVLGLSHPHLGINFSLCMKDVFIIIIIINEKNLTWRLVPRNCKDTEHTLIMYVRILGQQASLVRSRHILTERTRRSVYSTPDVVSTVGHVRRDH